jgi:hypothetical protein
MKKVTLIHSRFGNTCSYLNSFVSDPDVLLILLLSTVSLVAERSTNVARLGRDRCELCFQLTGQTTGAAPSLTASCSNNTSSLAGS